MQADAVRKGIDKDKAGLVSGVDKVDCRNYWLKASDSKNLQNYKCVAR